MAKRRDRQDSRTMPAGQGGGIPPEFIQGGGRAARGAGQIPPEFIQGGGRSAMGSGQIPPEFIQGGGAAAEEQIPGQLSMRIPGMTDQGTQGQGTSRGSGSGGNYQDAFNRGMMGGDAPARDGRAEQMLPDGRAVRSGEAEEAFRDGERMGAESLIRGAGMTTTGEERQAGPRMTKERIQEADKKLLDYKTGKASVERRIIHAQEWWKMRNWREIEGKKGTKGATEMKSATAWLWNCIVGKHADAIDSYPEPIILPRMADDREEAQRLSEIVPVVMTLNGFEEVYSLCQWQKMQEGTAAYGVFWDKNRLNGLGDIAIKKINMLNLFWEPGVNDIQDSRNVFYVTLVDNEQLESMYPQVRGKLRGGQTKSVSKYRTDDGVPLDGKSPVIDWYYHTWYGPRKVLHYCKYVGDEILYATEDQDPRGLYDDGNYPFVLDPLFPVEGSPAGYGYIDIGKDAQSDIDILNQAMVQNAVVSSTPRYFMRKDGGVNEEEFADWSKPIVHVGAGLGQDSLLPVQVNSMNGIAMNMLQQKIDELKFVTGNSDVNNGGTPSGVTAASAIAALKEDAGRSSKDSTKAAYRSFAKIVTMVIERIRQFYDIPRQFRILGRNGQEEFVSYSNQHIRPQRMAGGLGMEEGYRMPAFDIDVRAQRENAYTKMSQNELAMQFYNSGFFNPQLTDQSIMCLDMMEFKGKEEILQKIRQQGTMQEALMQVGQIALQLAQQYRPDIAEQLAMTLQGVAGDQAAAMMARSGGGGRATRGAGNAAAQATDATKKAEDPNESGIVRKARERAENASRPS